MSIHSFTVSGKDLLSFHKISCAGRRPVCIHGKHISVPNAGDSAHLYIPIDTPVDGGYYANGTDWQTVMACLNNKYSCTCIFDGDKLSIMQSGVMFEIPFYPVDVEEKEHQVFVWVMEQLSRPATPMFVMPYNDFATAIKMPYTCTSDDQSTEALNCLFIRHTGEKIDVCGLNGTSFSRAHLPVQCEPFPDLLIKKLTIRDVLSVKADTIGVFSYDKHGVRDYAIRLDDITICSRVHWARYPDYDVFISNVEKNETSITFDNKALMSVIEIAAKYRVTMEKSKKNPPYVEMVIDENGKAQFNFTNEHFCTIFPSISIPCKANKSGTWCLHAKSMLMLCKPMKGSTITLNIGKADDPSQIVDSNRPDDVVINMLAKDKREPVYTVE